MNSFLKSAIFPLVCCHAVMAQDTHVSLANEIVDLLSQTEVCLNLCRDEESVREVVPQLQELAKLAADIKERQDKLPDLTPEEDREIASLIRTYLTLQRAIDEHVDRIIAEQLLSPELAAILCISPDITPSSAPTTN
ncbi:MAG: hypothetical protein IKT79_01235 [Akkermansia sp.]|nr:hypothetical protein [Akkermansia sp.]